MMTCDGLAIPLHLEALDNLSNEVKTLVLPPISAAAHSFASIMIPARGPSSLGDRGSAVLSCKEVTGYPN